MPPVYCRNKEDRTTAENKVCEEYDDKRYYKGEYIPKAIYSDLKFIEKFQEYKQIARESKTQDAIENKLTILEQKETEEEKQLAQLKEEGKDWTLPGYDFLGPGTDLDKKRYHVPRSELDAVAKEHDLEYEKSHDEVDTRTADKKFIKGALQSGSVLGIAAAGAIEAKHQLGLDETFRPRTTTKPKPEVPAATNKHIHNSDSGYGTSSEDGGSASQTSPADWSSVRLDQAPPVYPPITTTFTRTFKNAVKGTNMNKGVINFTRTKEI